MNAARRFLTTTATTSKAAAAASIQAIPEVVDARVLPNALFNLIRRNIEARPEGSSGPIQIRNPFIGIANEGHNGAWVVPISARRQKQYLQQYPGWALPPSPLNRVDEPKAVQWVDGTLVTWEGSVPAEKKALGLYGSRKRMFKGHKHEREKASRVQERKDRLEGMEKRIEMWKKTKEEAKKKLKPSLPF
ncbi:uncharacterized protein LOC62_06G008479 [Vanrija pseudolonga]|uniref:Large ribosomal subunit protein mL59 domain-containing protein n=1 Tax=Vanrija pseudolonga TaxID=143232 RepID=A0AAF1BTM5_9TREE|nr:hypothetical protein LOC62_06G008479 [Vanrija pseudolonga]